MRKRHFLTVLLAWILVPSLSAQRITLEGEWECELGKCTLPGTTDENHLGSGEHPTDVTTQLTRLWPFIGILNYSREIHLPRQMEGLPLELSLERTKPTTLWVDGDSIGSLTHLHAAHVYRIPPLRSGKHIIRIRVDNRDEAVPSGVRGSHAWTNATQTNWNGILGNMELRTLPKSRIEKMDIYPDVESHTALVTLRVQADHKRKANFRLSCGSREQVERVALDEGENVLKMRLNLGEDVELWSEFHPVLHKMKAQLDGIGYCEEFFGMREFGKKGTQFTINGFKTFLRGTHDGCVFPLTGYCPTDLTTWIQLFKTAKEYGLNHFRFHSYTPTEAAFQAADELGMYLQVELPMWGKLDESTEEMNEYLLKEADGILSQFGHHPSFMALGIGNELSGDHGMMRRWIEKWREKDPRHLYTFGSNNTLGWEGVHEGEDYMVTCRMGGGKGYTTHTRSSFSFADAEQGGLLNNTHPNTKANYSGGTKLCPVPVVSHETCQFQVYPDYTEIPKYTGVLYPFNLEIFRHRLQENHLTEQIEDFHRANGHFVVQCDKADIEYCLRTPGFGGFQMLDLKDYPGQGSALCGILDALGESKGLVTPEEWGEFVSPVVVLAEMDKYCWDSNEIFEADIRVSNFLEEPVDGKVKCQLQGEDFSADLTFSGVRVEQGELSEPLHFSCPFGGILKPTKLILNITFGDFCTNHYPIWVYPERKVEGEVLFDLDKALAALQKGATVIYQPDSALIARKSVGGLFTPDYWNYAMFKTISERQHRPVSPGTLGLLMSPTHPLFRQFPTDGCSDFQWWPVARYSRPLVLDALSDRYRPLVQVIDNVERNHLLGILMEFQVGNGRLLLTTTDLSRISEWPEGKAYIRALKLYAASEAFQPRTTLSPEELRLLLTSESGERNIQGVENITDYSGK